MPNGDPFADGMAFFGSEVKRLRERAGMTQQELADAMHYSLDSIKSIEIGREFGSEKFARTADKIFGTGEQLERLREFITRVTMRPWFRDRMIVERKAAEIWEYETYVISGLLQTEAYMRAVVDGNRPALSRDEREEAVALRLERQAILYRDNPPHLWAILEESALRRIVGGQKVMAGQYEHLLTLSELPNVTIQIIPNGNGVTAGFGRSFSVLTFDANPALVYLEEIQDARYVRDPAKVRRYMFAYEHLRASALDESKSAELIKGERHPDV